MKGNTGFMIVLLIMIAALAMSFGMPGLIDGYYSPCPMQTPDTCKVFKESSGQHMLHTISDSGISALNIGDYDSCDVTYDWNLPAGRYGGATGSGTFTITGKIGGYSGNLACVTDPSKKVVVIYENGAPYEQTFGHLDRNLDWHETVLFYNDDTELIPDTDNGDTEPIEPIPDTDPPVNPPSSPSNILEWIVAWFQNIINSILRMFNS